MLSGKAIVKAIQYRTKFCASFLIINNFLSNKMTKFQVCDKSSVKTIIKTPVVKANS